MMRVLLTATLVVVAAAAIAACGGSGSGGDDGAPAATNATCLSSSCHGDPSLVKTIVNDLGAEETIPLYVNAEKYATTTHGSIDCVACHNDINAVGGAHAPVAKTYGGWARFSRKQPVETLASTDLPHTRNYYTAAARSCETCHTEHRMFKYSAHATIYKQRAAHIDDALTAIATAQEGKATTIGEDYVAGDCNRCHGSCGTCHFRSTIRRANADPRPITDFWDEVQRTDTAPGFNANMSEFGMDWTTNVESHEFRGRDYFATDAEGVCESCHTGYQRPAKNAYYWTDEGAGLWARVKAANVRRHPQTYELAISGDPSLSPLTGGTNFAHAAMVCADCHGTASGVGGNIHELPGMPYEWATEGDVQCVTCHAAYSHADAVVDLHVSGVLSAVGTRVACIGCHTYGLGRDFELAAFGTSTAHDVFIDPETNEVRPVVWKNGHAIAWYSHNWQRPAPAASYTDPNSYCAMKCHYSGNLVGAGY